MPSPMTVLRAPNKDVERANALMNRNVNLLREIQHIRATQGEEAAQAYMASANGFGRDAPLTKDADDQIPEMVATGILPSKQLGSAIWGGLERGGASVMAKLRGGLPNLPMSGVGGPGAIITAEERAAEEAAKDAAHAQYLEREAAQRAAGGNPILGDELPPLEMPPSGNPTVPGRRRR